MCVRVCVFDLLCIYMGSGDSSVVRAPDQKVAGSNPCWSGGRIFFSRVNFLS